jgi:GTPase
MRIEPKMLSFITLLSQSMTSRLFLKYSFILQNMIKNSNQIKGIMVITANANLQFITNRRIHAQIMIITDETRVTIAWETNIFMESISEVRLVRSLEGVIFSMNA